LIAYYKVIDQFNVKVLACRDQLLRYCDIFWRRGGITAGVIMGYHSHNIPLPKVSILFVKGVCSVAPYSLTTADTTILQQFTTYPYLIAEQITHLLYSRGSIKYVSAKLKNLTEQK